MVIAKVRIHTVELGKYEVGMMMLMRVAVCVMRDVCDRARTCNVREPQGEDKAADGVLGRCQNPRVVVVVRSAT